MGMSVESLKTEATKFIAPAKAISDVFIDTAEKMVALQMDSCNAYKDIAFNQLKKIPAIHNVEMAGDFLWGQIEPMSEFNKQVLSDCKAVMALNSTLTTGIKTALTPAKKAKPAATKAKPKPAAKAKPAAKPKTVKSIIPEEKKETVAPISKAKRAPKKAAAPSKTTTS